MLTGYSVWIPVFFQNKLNLSATWEYRKMGTDEMLSIKSIVNSQSSHKVLEPFPIRVQTIEAAPWL